MTVYIQAVAGALIAAILCCVLSRQGKELSVLLSAAVCCMVLAAAFGYFKPILEYMTALRETAQLDWDIFQAILKAVGIALTAQVASLICADSGNASIGKAVELLGTGAILWLSLPLMTRLLELVEQMVGNL